MSGDTIAAVITAGTSVLGVVGAVARTLIRLLRSVETAVTIAQQLATQLQAHVEHHDAAAAQLATTVQSHETQLAVLNSRLQTPPAAAGGVSTAN